MDRRTYLHAIGLTGVTSVAGCLDSRAAPDGDYDVGMSTVAFKPERISIKVGEEVVWRNTSKQGHTVTGYESGVPDGGTYFASGGFDSEQAAREAWTSGFGGRLVAGDTYAHSFETVGEFEYFCIPHERAGMVGSVVVEAE